ncbi:hypothetical protein BamMEX5DRAFT_5379 [Burkholderia ambifaria MEX-5]|uniref:Uncharacterized protein n=1 Tax=Burkholderia ambifaria MEX-5 TaxID=396597 RepID=B1TC63_9BURK|nr:hypothetical protein BamMEX5DRAFT_5379 [Burkholderia ambifaria MEX-5]
MMSLLTWVGPAARMLAGLFFVRRRKGGAMHGGYSNTGRKKLRS